VNDRFLFLLGSTRRGGNTEQLARLAASSLPKDVEVRFLALSDLPLPPFFDLRHEKGLGHLPLSGNAARLAEETLWATDLVIAAPTYWYSLPAQVKLYLDHFSGFLRVQSLDFKARMKGKRMWAITVNADDPSESGASDLLVATLERTAAYLGMDFRGALVGHGNRPGEVLGDERAVLFARRFFEPLRE